MPALKDSGLSAWIRTVRGIPATTRDRFIRRQPPRYPTIDVHTHLNSVHAYGWRGRPARDVIRALDRAGVRGLVDLDGGFGDGLSAEIARTQALYPDRLAVFAGISPSTWAASRHFGDLEADRLEDSVRRGARGLKVWKDVGLNVRDHEGRLIELDDSRLEPLWKAAAALNVPVVIHVADPPAFFQPLDERNERRDELRRHPDWHYQPIRATRDGPGFPSHEELLDQFERLVTRNPGTTFIGAHLASSGDDLARLSNMLRNMPNLSVDISARINELGRKPDEARALIEAFQDRILFGTDSGPDPRWYPIYFQFLETASRNLPYSFHYRPYQGSWRIDGLNLSDAALRKVYSENALRLIRFGA